MFTYHTSHALKKINGSSNKIKTIWSLINENRPSKKCDRAVLSIKSSNGDIDDPQLISNSFNSFFASIGSSTSFNSTNYVLNSSISNPNLNSSPKSMFLFETSKSEVESEILALKPKHSAGADGVSSHLLRLVFDLVSSPLCYIINLSFDTGRFPEALKHAIVRPVHKKGDKKDQNNYRPIAILSTFSKVFERVFLSRLLSFLERNSLLSPHQYGFTKSKSTVDAVNAFITATAQALDSGKPSVGMFFDLRKAFDMVDHKILQDKISSMGIRGIAHSWICSYLNGRTQQVKIPFTDSGNCEQWATSSSEIVPVGVPQGSVLGPVLFLLFINDLPLGVGDQLTRICLFADDTSLSLSAADRTDIIIKAHEKVNVLLQWFNANKMIINSSKTQIIDFQINTNKNANPLTFYIGDSEVNTTASTKFLGVQIDQHLRFKEHINLVSSRLSSGIFVLRNISSYLDASVGLAAYYGVIFPFLSYAVEVWGYENFRTKFIFRLQKRAIRTIFRKPYRTSCKALFREHNILTFPSLYILKSIMFIRKNINLFHTQNIHNYSLRSNYNISIPPHKTSFYERQVSFSGVRLFNLLPASLKSEGSVVRFEKKLRTIMLNGAFYSVQDFILLYSTQSNSFDLS